jgi:pimeloyl-ACP methyl ester carboxylesterase
MRRALGVVVVLAAFLAGAVLPASASGSRSRLRERECPLLIPAGLEATCYSLTVPEDRQRPNGETIRLAVMVLHSVSQTPEPDPVVFLPGGPGGSGIEGFENFIGSPMLENRDLILFDPRGVGLSEPSLDCPEVHDALVDDFRHPDSHRQELGRLRDATRECRDRLVDDGIDLDSYDTVANAADVADLREAMDIDEWNLYGTSYGTRLALQVMRADPAGVRTATLDSVYPNDRQGLDDYVSGFEAAFKRLEAACNADVDCSELQPNLRGLLDQVYDRYNDSPVEVAIAEGDSFVVNGEDILAGIWDAMYDSEVIPALPSIIESLAGGDTSILAVFADSALQDRGSDGMFVSTECADNGTTASDRQLIADPERAAVIVRHSAEPFCALWDVKPLPPSFRRPVRSRIPTLVFAGTLDPVTPASDSQRIADRLRNATYVEFAGLGHVVTRVSDCARAIRQEFLDDPSARPDTTCADVPAPPFLSQGLI